MIIKYKFKRRKGGVAHIVNETTGYIICGADLRWDFDDASSYVPSDKTVCESCSRVKYSNHYRCENRKRCKEEKLESLYGFYGSDEWASLRFDVLKDAERCLCCGAGKDATRLTVDHIKPISKYPELKTDRSNLQVLCMLCNKGKGARHEIDFREGAVPLTIVK